MKAALFTSGKSPAGDRELTISLNNLGNLLNEQGDHDAARPYLEPSARDGTEDVSQ